MHDWGAFEWKRRAPVETQEGTMTEGQIRIAIQVLRAYVDEALRIDDDTLVEDLEKAIEDAGNKQLEHIVCEIDDDPPPTPSA